MPHDISVVGFNDLSTVAPTTPSLTTLHLPLHAMGMAAAERLLAQIQGRTMFTEPVIMPVTLMARGSTRSCARRAKKSGSSRGSSTLTAGVRGMESAS